MTTEIQQDPLKGTRKLVEITKNAAQFNPVIVPLNSLDDVEEFADLMEAANGRL